MLFILLPLLIGAGVGYYGSNFFKLTVPLWIVITLGVVGAFFGYILGASFMFRLFGEAFVGGLINVLFGSFFGALLCVWSLKFLNRTKPTVPHAPKTIKRNPSASSKYSITSIQETETSYEPSGYEERAIDNSRNDGFIKRKLIISREWTRTISLEKSATNSFSASAGVKGFFDLGLEQTLQDKYHVEINERKTFTEEIELEVVPRSKTVLRIEWKTIWQNGVIEITDQNQNIFFIPFKVSKGLTFDQIQEKVN